MEPPAVAQLAPRIARVDTVAIEGGEEDEIFGLSAAAQPPPLELLAGDAPCEERLDGVVGQDVDAWAVDLGQQPLQPLLASGHWS